jgi:hypothetical protein
MTDAAYAVISHGANARGAVKLNYRDPSNSVAGRKWCSIDVGDPIEKENCDAGNAIVAAAEFNDGTAVATDTFDDVVVFKGKVLRVCAARAENWTVGADNCSGNTPAMLNGATANVANTAIGKTGSVTMTCNAGVLAQGVMSCTPSAPINGGWSVWGSCSAACGPGIETRSCDNPPPSGGGAACAGPTSQACNNGACGVPIDGGWSGWSACDAACGPGNQTRSCDSPPPSGGGAACAGPSSNPCNNGACGTPIDGGWSGWGSCDAPCGPGNQSRSCDSPAPSGGGAPCAGPASQACNTAACPACAPDVRRVNDWGGFCLYLEIYDCDAYGNPFFVGTGTCF